MTKALTIIDEKTNHGTRRNCNVVFLFRAPGASPKEAVFVNRGLLFLRRGNHE